MTRAQLLAVLERHAARCCDDPADREVLADAIASALGTELQFTEGDRRAPGEGAASVRTEE